MALLFVAADREVIVTVNGSVLGTAADPATARSLDITPLLRQGDNTISIRAKDSAPVRIATLLELNGDLATKRWLASDATWIAPGGPAVLAGSAADSFDLKKIFDAYNSWQLAKRNAQSAATDPASFTLPPGFRAELIRSAQPEEDSWVAMAFDPQGRVTLAREKRGLLQFDPRDGTMNVLNDTLLECRGLLYAHANNSKTLYRLDAPGAAQEILRTEGGVGHGRNHLKLGPDNHLWLINGNNVLLPKGLAKASPLLWRDEIDG